MIDIKKIREEFDATVEQLARRGVEKANVQKAKDLDEKRRSLISETETLKAKRNSASKEIGMIAKQGGDIAAAKEEMRKIGDRIAEIDRELAVVETDLRDTLLSIPNLPAPEIPTGMDSDSNVVVRTVGAGASSRAFARDLRNLLSVWSEMQANTKRLRTPCCIFQEPDLCERVVRDWLTEDVDAIVIDDEASYESMREVTGRISRRAKGKIRRYDGVTNVFEHYGLERQLAEAFSRQVPLKSGGYLVIDETEALIAVDVNTGHHKGKGSQEEAILEVNLEAVEEVARQLRLRNIGGLVVLDLIDMKSRKHQKQVYRALKDALKRDRARTNVLEISELGLLEMSRQRQDRSILSMLTSKCPYCSGHGLVKSPMSVSIELQRKLTSLLRKAEADKKPFEPKIVIAPQVMQRLRTEDADILAQMQKQFNTRLTFVSELHRHPEAFSILDAATSQVLYSQT